ncbi:MAG: alpha/beta hydrolase [Oligoflexia bacterium]|nr:alpha/beta hydrolase [Oligoflexia bacterium]
MARQPVLRGLHWTAHRLLPLAGYRLEVRRCGDLKLGLWRKNLRSAPTRAGRGAAAESPRRLVLIPGFGDTPLSWLGVVGLLQPLLKRKIDELVLVDFPGFTGGLARERSFHSMDLLMDGLFDALDSLRPQVILGHSLGGWLGARYAGLCGAGERPKIRHRHYSGPATLLLADPAGAFGDPSLRAAWEERFQKLMKEGFQHLRPHVFAREPFWFEFFLPEVLDFAGSEEVIAFMKSIRDEHLVEKLLPSIGSRVWLLWGESDTLTPSRFASAWLESLPEATLVKLVLLKGTGHSPQLERPGLTALVLSLILGGSGDAVLRHRLAGRWWNVIERERPAS